MIEPLRRWSHPRDLKPGTVSDFLKAHEPRMEHKKNAELIRVLGWALPLYHEMESKKKADDQHS
jgi:hypothetical protein